jgi:hypothetical protein
MIIIPEKARDRDGPAEGREGEAATGALGHTLTGPGWDPGLAPPWKRLLSVILRVRPNRNLGGRIA